MFKFEPMLLLFPIWICCQTIFLFASVRCSELVGCILNLQLLCGYISLHDFVSFPLALYASTTCGYIFLFIFCKLSLLWFLGWHIWLFIISLFIHFILTSCRPMEFDSHDYNLIPFCQCGNGKFQVKTAGPKANHAGRLYYRCSLKGNTCGYWKWCDEYHQETSSEMSKFVSDQVYTPKARMEHSTSATSIPTFLESSSIQPPRRRSNGSDIDPLIVYLFMATVVVLLCIIIAKL